MGIDCVSGGRKKLRFQRFRGKIAATWRRVARRTADLATILHFAPQIFRKGRFGKLGPRCPPIHPALKGKCAKTNVPAVSLGIAEPFSLAIRPADNNNIRPANAIAPPPAHILHSPYKAEDAPIQLRRGNSVTATQPEPLISKDTTRRAPQTALHSAKFGRCGVFARNLRLAIFDARR